MDNNEYNNYLPPDLPPVLQEIAEVIGNELMIKLVNSFGGVRIYVPLHSRKVRPDHPLALAIGLEQARRLSEEFAGIELSIPRLAAGIRAVRNAEIHRLHKDDNWPAWRIARKFMLTERQVYSILSAGLTNDTQASLF